MISKHLLFLSLIIFATILSSCSATKKTSHNNISKNNSPKFLDEVRFYPKRKKSGGKHGEKPNALISKKKDDNNNNSVSELQYKYASLLDVAPSQVTNLSLFELIDDWYGAPYAIGGNSKDGIDCSGFSKMLVNNIYNEEIPRTSQQQYDACRHIKKDKLIEGDLVFFHTYGGGNITHVGVYLQNNKFVHASSSKGVMISDLDDEYWRKAFRGGGRIDKNE